jgi:predicted NAD/FAD-binding protein
MEGAGSGVERFDAVVLATHADEALAVLSDPSAAEQQALGSWRYSKNRVVLHTDPSLLGSKRRLWAAWNYHRRRDATQDSAVAITYYMNRLQRLRAQRDYFVTLNCTQQIEPSSIIYEVDYTHPVYTPQSPSSQSAILEFSGTRSTYFCGAYLRYGFHEDAVWSALKVADRFGLGWE